MKGSMYVHNVPGPCDTGNPAIDSDTCKIAKFSVALESSNLRFHFELRKSKTFSFVSSPSWGLDGLTSQATRFRTKKVMIIIARRDDLVL